MLEIFQTVLVKGKRVRMPLEANLVTPCGFIWTVTECHVWSQRFSLCKAHWLQVGPTIIILHYIRLTLEHKYVIMDKVGEEGR